MNYILGMNVEHFDLNLLRVLDALLTERAVGRAAVRLGRCYRRPELSPGAAPCCRNRPCRVCPEQARKPAGSSSESDDRQAAVQSRS